VTVDFNGPLEIARWRPLVQWLLAIPQLLVSQVLMMLRGVLQFVAFFCVLFTKQIPESIFNAIVMTFRYQWRVTTYLLFMRETYPPFSFETSADDDGIDPAVLSVQRPGELSRFMPLVKWFLALPHYVALVVLVIGFLFAWLASFFIVIFTGRYPEGIRRYAIGLSRWGYRVMAYVGFLRDEYPPFSLQ
jgi:hypothetical protein